MPYYEIVLHPRKQVQAVVARTSLTSLVYVLKGPLDVYWN